MVWRNSLIRVDFNKFHLSSENCVPLNPRVYRNFPNDSMAILVVSLIFRRTQQLYVVDWLYDMPIISHNNRLVRHKKNSYNIPAISMVRPFRNPPVSC